MLSFCSCLVLRACTSTQSSSQQLLYSTTYLVTEFSKNKFYKGHFIEWCLFTRQPSYFSMFFIFPNRLKAQQLPSNDRSHGAGHWPQNAATALLLQGTYQIDHLSGTQRGNKKLTVSKRLRLNMLGIIEFVCFWGTHFCQWFQLDLSLRGVHHRSLLQPIIPSEP